MLREAGQAARRLKPDAPLSRLTDAEKLASSEYGRSEGAGTVASVDTARLIEILAGRWS